ncbi:hypothetical protein [Corynebacterium pacaense]|nr:hypothetical protein [Corynebacterium pacaense]
MISGGMAVTAAVSLAEGCVQVVSASLYSAFTASAVPAGKMAHRTGSGR